VLRPYAAFIWMTLVAGLGWTCCHGAHPVVPHFLALALVFWNVHQPVASAWVWRSCSALDGCGMTDRCSANNALALYVAVVRRIRAAPAHPVVPGAPARACSYYRCLGGQSPRPPCELWVGGLQALVGRTDRKPVGGCCGRCQWSAAAARRTTRDETRPLYAVGCPAYPWPFCQLPAMACPENVALTRAGGRH